MEQFGLIHWLIVLAVIFLLFGGARIPEAMEAIRRRFGKGDRRGPGRPTHPVPVTGPVETSRR